MRSWALMIATLLAAAGIAAACYTDDGSRSQASKADEGEIAGQRLAESAPAMQLQKTDPAAGAQALVTGRLVIEDEGKQTFTIEAPQGSGAETVEDKTLEAPPGVDLLQLDGEEVTVSIQDGRVTDIKRDLADGDAVDTMDY